MGVAGACRGNELVELSIHNVTDLGSSILVNIKNTKNNIDRVFVVKNSVNNPVDLIKLCRNYMALRKPDTNHSRFFVQYKDGKCTTQPIGKNTFGQLPKKIATFLQLPEPSLYTGHCFRRTSASLLADSGANVDVLKRHGGWKSSSVAEGYVESSINNKKMIAEKIFGHENETNIKLKNQINTTSNASTSSTENQINTTSNASIASTSFNRVLNSNDNDFNKLFNFNFCTNVNISVNVNQK